MSPNVISEFITNVWGIATAFLVLGVSIFVHELGHYLAARKRGLKVERFSIGFGPKIFSWKRNGIEYRLSAIPLGGYVALPQLADMSAIEGENESKPEDLAAVSYADKMIVFVMGAVFNLIFAFVIALVLWQVGVPSTENNETTTIGYIPERIEINPGEEVPSPSQLAGLKPGDKVIAVDGTTVDNPRQYMQVVAAGSGRSDDGRPMSVLTVERDGSQFTTTAYPVLQLVNAASGEHFRTLGIEFGNAIHIGNIFEPSPAFDAGLQPGDRINTMDGIRVYDMRTIIDYLKANPGKSVELEVSRGDETLTLDMLPKEAIRTKPTLELKLSDSNASVIFAPIYSNPDDGNPASLDKAIQNIVVYFADDNAKAVFPGIAIGVEIMNINGGRPDSLADLKTMLDNAKSGSTITYSNGNAQYTANLPQNSESEILPPKTQMMIGFGSYSPEINVHKSPVELCSSMIRMTATVLAGLIHPKSDIKVKNMSGVVTIARVIHHTVKISYRKVLWFIAFLNINLAVLNLLPVPVLDGGHMVFATIEKLRGKKLPFNVITAAHSAFMLLILCFVIYIVLFDFIKWGGDADVKEQREQMSRQYQMIYIEPYFPKPDEPVNSSES